MFKKLTYFFVACVILLGAFYFTNRSKNSHVPPIKNTSSKILGSEVPIVNTKIYENFRIIPKVKKTIDYSSDQQMLECWDQLTKQMEKTCDGECSKRKLSQKSLGFKQILDGGWFDRKNPVPEKQESTLGKFLYALAISNQLLGNNTAKIDEEKALHKFDELIDSDSKNAAYYLYKANLQNNLKDEAGARKTLEELRERATYYDGHYVSWTSELILASTVDVGDYFAAIGLSSSMPLPNAQAVFTLRQSLNLDLEYLGHLMVKKAIEVNGEHREILWTPLEYTVGYSMINPDKNNPRWKIPTLKELSDNFNNSSVHMDFFEMIKDKKDCNIATLEEWMEQSREKLLNDLSR